MKKQKLSKELIDKITLYVENGNTNKDACIMSGIGESTLYYWLKLAEEAPKGRKSAYLKLCIELSESLKRAEVKFKAFHISNINTAAEKNWTASAWMLERRYPEEYGRKMELRNPDGTPVEFVRIVLPDNGRDTGNNATTETN